MKNITFIIGNGFDKQIGLDTGYNHFLDWYLKQPSESKCIENYKKTLLENGDSEWWTDAEIAMGKYLNEFNQDTITEYYINIRDFKIRLAEYLADQEARCDFSNEKEIGDKFCLFITGFQKDILLQHKIRNTFSQEETTRYNFLTFNYTSVLQEILNITKNTHHPLYKTSLSSGNVATGNIGQYFAIHGSLESSIIMGVNDASQLAYMSDLLPTKLRRTLIKPEINAALGRQENDNAEHCILGSDVLAIYGWKMGDTDKKWRELVGKWLKVNGRSVVIFGHKKLQNANFLIPEDVLDYVDDKQTEFLKKVYPSIDEDSIEEMRDKIFIIDRTRYLDFDLLHSDNLVTV